MSGWTCGSEGQETELAEECGLGNQRLAGMQGAVELSGKRRKRADLREL